MITLVHRACGLVEVLGGGGGSSGWYIRARCLDGAERLLSADPVFWSDPAGTVRNALWAALVADAQRELLTGVHGRNPKRGDSEFDLSEEQAGLDEELDTPENGQQPEEVEAD